MLLEEYERSERLCRLMREELASLPKGSVRVRVIRGREYYYLNHREGSRVVSDYVPASKVDDLRAKVSRRRELKVALKEQKRVCEQISRAARGLRDSQDGHQRPARRQGR